MRIVEAGREADRKKDVDRKRQWLQLLSQDTFFTTQQVRETCRAGCLDVLLSMRAILLAAGAIDDRPIPSQQHHWRWRADES